MKRRYQGDHAAADERFGEAFAPSSHGSRPAKAHRSHGSRGR